MTKVVVSTDAAVRTQSDREFERGEKEDRAEDGMKSNMW